MLGKPTESVNLAVGIILFFILLALAPEFFVANFAKRMGHDTSLWLFYGLMSWPIALIHLQIISDTAASARIKAKLAAWQPCPYCAELILRQVRVCPICQRDLDSGWSFSDILEIKKSTKYSQELGADGVEVFLFNGKEYSSLDIAEQARKLYLTRKSAR